MKKQFRITINGKTFDVVAETTDGSLPSPISPTIPTQSENPSPVQEDKGSVPSPLAGKVVSIDVRIGKVIQAGDSIMTLEAMKMNTIVSAPFAGTVTSIDVNPGDSIEEGQSLMVLS